MVKSKKTVDLSCPCSPFAGVIQGADGALYGTTHLGGVYKRGVVYKINTDGSSFKVLHCFEGYPIDGSSPRAGLFALANSELYGTTSDGGTNGNGVVFKLNPDGSGYKVLHHFSGKDGELPRSRLIQCLDGALYGTTKFGGVEDEGESFWRARGVIYRLNPDGTKFRVVHVFIGVGGDGGHPLAGVIQGLDGALYGTTYWGGIFNKGVVYKVNLDGSGFKVLHSFTIGDSDTSNPCAGVIQGSDGALYGTTYCGGATGYGVVYKLNPDGSGYKVLHRFKGGRKDGLYSKADVIQGMDGALYGTASQGGAYGGGIVYRLNPDGSGFQILHSFEGGEDDGELPWSSVYQASDGALYGTTAYGGLDDKGVIYKLNPDGSGYQVLHRF